MASRVDSRARSVADCRDGRTLRSEGIHDREKELSCTFFLLAHLL